MANKEYQEQLDVSQEQNDDNGDDNGDHEEEMRADDGTPELYPIEEPENTFHFVDIQGVQGIGDAGPGRSTSLNSTRLPQSRALDEEEDCQVEDVDETAGKVIGQDQKLYDKWKRIFGQGQAKGSFDMDVDEEPCMDVAEEPGMEKRNPYAPFTAELDWRIARWAIKDNPGHKAFDRLLSIPGVGHPL